MPKAEYTDAQRLDWLASKGTVEIEDVYLGPFRVLQGDEELGQGPGLRGAIDAAMRKARVAPSSSPDLQQAIERARSALPEFRQQDDYLLAHGASLMSEDSHEIVHIDTLTKIVRAVLASDGVAIPQTGQEKNHG